MKYFAKLFFFILFGFVRYKLFIVFFLLFLSKYAIVLMACFFLPSCVCVFDLGSAFVFKLTRTKRRSEAPTRGGSVVWPRSTPTCPRPFPVRPRAPCGAARTQVGYMYMYSYIRVAYCTYMYTKCVALPTYR